MKHFLDYFNENQKAEQLVSFIKNSATDEEINKLYNTYIKINGNESGKNFDMLKKWISDKMINDNKEDHTKIFQRAVFSACEKYSCYEQIINLANKQNSNDNKDNNAFLKIELNGNTQVTFKDICKQFNDIPENFFNSIFKTEGSGQPVIGKGEYLLRLLSQNPDKKNKGGDVVINNIPIEVKNLITNEASLGNNLKGNVELIFKFLGDIIRENIKPQTISAGTKIKDDKEDLIKIKKSINIIADKEINDLLNIFKKNINNFYFDGKIKKDYDDIIIEAIKKLKELKDISDFKQFIKIFTALYTIMYCSEEDAKYLCLINKDKTFNFIAVNNNIETFNNILNDNNFPFFKIRSSSGKQFIQLKY